MNKVAAFIGTDEAGRAYDQALRACPRYRAYFTDGSRWEFHATGMIAAQADARFWAEFTGRELSAVAGL